MIISHSLFRQTLYNQQTMTSFIHLFQKPSVTDKLKFFTNLFEASEVNADIALALLKVIHKELGNEQTRDRTAYKRYAETIEILRFHESEMLQQIVDAWKNGRAQDPEWLLNGTVK